MGLIAIDFETYLISEEMPVPKPVCLSFYNEESQGVLSGIPDMGSFLFKILSSNDIIVAHNFSFEGNVITKWFPHLRDLMQDKLAKGEIVCTKVYEQLIDVQRKTSVNKFSLDNLVKVYFNEDISESKKDPNAWRLRYSELDGIPIDKYPKEAYEYALNDSIWAYKLYLEQKKTYIDIRLTVLADYYLNYMAAGGMLLDKSVVNLIEKEILGKIIPKYKELEKKGIVSYCRNGKYKKNMKELREYIEKNVENAARTVKNNIATSKEHLEKYREDPIIGTFLDIMQYEKILTAFISRLKDNSIIRTSYNACVSTGRTSSSSSKAYPSVNIQQMPRELIGTTYDIRNCFTAREGYHIVSIDYSGLELSVCANQLKAFLGMSNMADIINSGNKPTDMHSMLAYRIKNLKEKTNITYEEFVTNKKKEGYKEYRQLAKPINLGFPGGIGYDTMRTLLFREGIIPKLVVLNESRYEDKINRQVTELRREGHPVRLRRVSFDKYQLVWDELVLLKWEMFKLYPDLEYFLKDGHPRLLTGESKKTKNEWGEWETEPMYRYRVGDFTRDWCMYTQVCNGFLMQAPAAQGAKRAMCTIIRKYQDSTDCRPLAFIHDEVLLEVKIGKEELICEEVSDILISDMQKTLPHVRIAVEAEVCGKMWKKSGGIWSKEYWKDKLL